MITQQELKEILHYDPETGFFIWRKCLNMNTSAGKVAGWSSDGYIRIQIKKKSYMAHRLAWLYVYGYFPKEIDHINLIRDDNRIINLRECSRSQNLQNVTHKKRNSLKFKNVCYRKDRKKYQVQCTINGKKYHVGYYGTAEQAHAAYCDFAEDKNERFFRA